MKVFRTPIFSMSEEKPGVVSCRVGPADEPMDQDLRRSFDGIQTDAAKVRPYVPSEFASDPLYAAPTDEEERLAKEAKQARRNATQPKTGTRSRKRAKKDN
ncbi:uncharacterized protein PITG_01309 [Phytophthora infestans T30-4]|uniref:Uncharacterized protein n=1 Tax=Phytophthora infestans (strain T30-4) TaxID=403677 RepID=D0MV70_PHYIT|nr:uncharacterized protein PITG_01309 [Phytophthora infestans T30-4]EEY61066.1 hypothetical protein PITG_01309 [Phytophthora infestans T30-4]|eukprot:XP_002907983.1 hypothetical protein PITG_01309 [Phytophthora infestans T30-4]